MTPSHINKTAKLQWQCRGQERIPPDPKTARDIFYVASCDSRDQAQMASEPENLKVVVGGWIGASRTQSAATATVGDATLLPGFGTG